MVRVGGSTDSGVPPIQFFFFLFKFFFIFFYSNFFLTPPSSHHSKRKTRTGEMEELSPQQGNTVNKNLGPIAVRLVPFKP
jgi:hypothetical protein